MDKGKEYLIPVSGMAIGQHNYHYVIDDDFFAQYDYSEVKQGRVDIDLDVDRKESVLTLDFNLSGNVLVPCDRCADEFLIPIEGNNVFVIKTGVEKPAGDDDIDVAYLPSDQGSFDISELIYEYIILSIPIHRVHPEGQCNPKVVELLNACAVSEGNGEDDEIDPRWAALKNIKENNQND